MKDQDILIPHFRLAVTKLKAQNSALREKLDQQHDERSQVKSEMELLQKACEEAESKNQLLALQVHEMEEAKNHDSRETERIKRQLQQEVHELKSTRLAEADNTIAKLKSDFALSEETINQQKEVRVIISMTCR